MESSLISKQIPSNLKASLKILIISIFLAFIVGFIETIIFTVKTAEIDSKCGPKPAAIVQTISYYPVLITLIVFMASANRLMKAYILIAAIPTIAIKFISFIMMMSSLNQVWGTCYIKNSQISSFIISDFFWMFLIIFYYFSLLKMQQKFPETFYNTFSIKSIWKN